MPVPRWRCCARVELLESRALLSAAPSGGEFPPGALMQPAARIPIAANVPYTTSGSQQGLDVYEPDAPPPPGGWPVVLAIHGGGWRRFNKEQYAHKVVGPLLAGGFAVVAPNYRLSAPGAPSWPDNFLDIRQAVLWIRANAASYQFNPLAVAAMGESAGGHLAALLGTNPDGPLNQTGPPPAALQDLPIMSSARVEAVVDFFGPTDLVALDEQSALARPAVEQFLGTTPDQNPALYAAASPVDHVAATDPPMMILQGSADPIVPADQSRELAMALTNAGVPNSLEILPGATHGFGFRAGGRDLLPQILAFLRQAL
jgi:acetyl esterase/lipase